MLRGPFLLVIYLCIALALGAWAVFAFVRDRFKIGEDFRVVRAKIR